MRPRSLRAGRWGHEEMKDQGTTTVDKSEFRKLPYLTHIPTDGRIIPIQTYYDHANSRWLTWIVSGDRLQELRVVNLVHGMYISNAPAAPEDDHILPFAETVCKHFCTPEISKRMQDASQDLINGLGYIEKYFILLNHARQFPQMNANALLQVELEGVFGVHRSYYDILQGIINEVHSRYSTQKVNLPDSFRKVMNKTPEELASKYHFPPPLIEFYQQKRRFFITCSEIRNDVFHHGHSMGTVYRFDDGFAVGVDEPPWTRLNAIVRMWPDERMRNNRLGCVLVVYALLAEDMFKTMALLGDALLASFHGPPKALFNDHVYLRTDFSRHLHKLNDYASKQWLPAESALSELTRELLQQPTP